MPELITKSIPLDDAEFKVRLKTREFEGYCSTFGNMDSVGDIIEPGAFRKTISERGPKGANKIKVLWDHWEPFGMPVEMREDAHGLYVIGRASDTEENKDRLKYMAEGVVDSMSIGFTIPEGKSWWEEDGDAPYGIVRHIEEVKLFEFSPIMFPANELAVISNVRKHAELNVMLKSLTGEDLSRHAKNLPQIDERKLDAALEALREIRVEFFGTEEEKRALKGAGEPPARFVSSVRSNTATANGLTTNRLGTPTATLEPPAAKTRTDPDEVEEALQSALEEIGLKSILGRVRDL